MAVILVIEDDDKVRRFIRRILELEKHEIFEASNGLEGIKLYKEQKIDLIVTDIVMPVKEGIETIIELRKIDPEIKIIAISGGGRIKPEGYLIMAEKLGATVTLEKPFSSKALIDAVNQVLDYSS